MPEVQPLGFHSCPACTLLMAGGKVPQIFGAIAPMPPSRTAPRALRSRTADGGRESGTIDQTCGLDGDTHSSPTFLPSPAQSATRHACAIVDGHIVEMIEEVMQNRELAWLMANTGV